MKFVAIFAILAIVAHLSSAEEDLNSIIAACAVSLKEGVGYNERLRAYNKECRLAQGVENPKKLDIPELKRCQDEKERNDPQYQVYQDCQKKLDFRNPEIAKAVADYMQNSG